MAETTYYVWFDTGEHSHQDYYESIFEALADYHQAILDGPNAAGEEQLVEVEFGYMEDDDF
ncbi:hypothetical protein OAK65_03740 [Synechococcus sp. AH-551-N17]|nr:hypothetical protein [Synechococcus sp. AH-551-N17]